MPVSKKIFIVIFFLFLAFPGFIFGQESKKNLNVTANVPADPQDFTIQTQQVTSGNNFPQNSAIQYKINYGNLLSSSINFKIEASWYDGTTENEANTVSVADYLSGSATNGYGGATPIIDVINKKITWNIVGFPPNSNQSVNFSLITNNNYQGSQVVTFKVASRLRSDGFNTPYSNVFSTYLYNAPVSPTPNPTTPKPSPGITITPTPPSTPYYQTIEVMSVSDNTATIFVKTPVPAISRIRYGTSPTNLSQSITGNNSSESLISLIGLSADTTYYFRVTSLISKGRSLTSDIYTFKTAQNSKTSSVNLSSFVATSNETILNQIGDNSSSDQPKDNYIILPKDTVFQFKFALNAPSGAKIQALIRPKNVLGVNTYTKKVEASTEFINLIEIQPGIYAGNLQTNNKSGAYEIIARITDKNNAITEQKIAELKVVNKFTVLKKDKSPIEGARVLFFVFNESNNKYQTIPASALAEGNPVFTDKDGVVNTVLPQGKYKAEISRLGFKDQTVKFIIGNKANEQFPIVKMDETGVDIFRISRYYLRTANDIFLFNTFIYAQILTGSARFFDLVAFIVLLSLVTLSLLAFAKKNHIPVSSLKSYFFYLKDKNTRNDKYIHGVVYDNHDQPISQANVYLANETDEAIISHVKTNKNGEFFFRKGKDKYLLMVMKKGFKSTSLIKYEEKDHIKFKITLEEEGSARAIAHNFSHFLESILGMGFEVILIASLVFEFLFLNSFGIIKTLPFLAISIFNLTIWTLHVKHKHWEN